jgi:Arc/MetJ-type ribon-helix-helix transcriptional regulator
VVKPKHVKQVQLALPPRLEGELQALIKAGHFATRSDAMREAIRRLIREFKAEEGGLVR